MRPLQRAGCPQIPSHVRSMLAGDITFFEIMRKKSERGLQLMGHVETVEIREERADFPTVPTSPEKNARRGQNERKAAAQFKSVAHPVRNPVFGVCDNNVTGEPKAGCN